MGYAFVFVCFIVTFNSVKAQTTIASESFENSLTLFTASGNGYTYYSGNSATADGPASSPFFTQGSFGWGVKNGSGVLTSSNINTTGYTSIGLSFRLASFTLGSTGNGADPGDIVTVEVSPNGGTNYYSTVRVLGRGNAYWSYAGGTGIATTTYDGNATPIDFQPTNGGSNTTEGFSTVSITNLPETSNLRVRISLLTNNNAELYVIDEFKVLGTLLAPCASPLNAGTATITSTTGCASTNFTLNATGVSVGTGISYQWQSSPTGLAGTWTNISGANATSLATSASSTTYYQLLTTCSNDNSTNTTNSVSYTVTGSPCTCRTYSSNYANNTIDADITSVTVGSMTNVSACGAVVGTGGIAFRYSNYTGSVSGPSEQLGSTVNFSLTSNVCTSSAYSNGFQVYVDWNQDGDFSDAGEQVYSASASVSGTHTETGSFVVPLTATLGTTRMRVVNVEITFPTTTNYAQSNYSWGETEDYCFTVLAATNCSGVPNNGTATITSSSGCTATNFTLNTTGTTIGTGITYQWQSSPTGLAGTWTNISGANSPSLVTNTSVTTYYQLVTTCSFSGSSSSTNVVSYTVSGNPCTCLNYPANYPSNAADEDITNVTVGSMSNSSVCGALAPGAGSIAFRYSNYTGSVSGPTEMLGALVPFSLTMTTCGGNFGNFFQIYVDWNQDGDFSDAGEQVYSQNPNVLGNQTATGSFTVPITATLGITRMRVLNNETTANTTNYAQSVSFSYGETEDYCFTVTASTPCTGIPSPGNTLASSTTVSGGGSTTLSIQNVTAGSGVTYQWYSNTTNSIIGGTLISGATNSTYTTTISAPTWFYCVVTCAGNSGTSTPVQITIAACNTNLYNIDPCFWDNNIDDISISNLNQTNTGCNGGTGTVDYTSIIVNFLQGGSYPWTITSGEPGSWVGFWIDFNDNNSFGDPGEFVGGNSTISTLNSISSNSAATQVNIPAGAALGNHRMRVRLVNGTANQQNLSTSCTTYNYGETHDYTANITAPCTAPSTQASIGAFTSTSATGTTVNWVRGNGTGGVIVVARLTSTAEVTPSNGTSYTANSIFGAGIGSQLTGTGNFVVYNGTGTSVNVTGLASGSNYTFTVYEYNTASTCYLIPGSSSAVSTLCAPFTGTYSVGSGFVAGEAGHYATLTLAVADYNTRCITGPLVFLLTDATYSTGTGETFPITINSNGYASAVNTLTIKPNTGVTSTITNNSTSAPIILNGADYVTIDGSNGSIANSVCPRTQATRNLTIRNTNTGTANNAVVWIQNVNANGSTYNTIMNCNIIGNSSTTTFFGIGSADNTLQPYNTSGGQNNNNNQFINNGISNVQLGILSVGQSIANRNTGNIINLNDISSCRWGGILVGYESGTIVSGNSITDVSSSSADDVFGIGIGLVQILTGTSAATSECLDVTVSYNNIGSIRHLSTNSASGIIFGASTSGTHTITNNMISGVLSNATPNDYISGMHIGGGAAQYNIYHNTIAMQGVTTASSNNAISTCIAITNSTYNVNFRNNLLSNTQTNNSNTMRFACIALAASTYGTFTSNFNNFYCAGSSGVGIYQIGMVGGVNSGATMQTTLANWRTATGKDANSFNVAPVFVSATNLHLQAVAGNTSLDNTGTNLSITNDIDCDSRSSTPDIGADEFIVSTTFITVSGSLTPLTTCYGTASTSTSFNVSGTGLTGNITVNAPTGFEVSLSASSGYASSVTLTQTSGSITSVPVYFRIAASASVGALSGNITLLSSGASTVTIAINGTVNALPSAVTVSPTTSTIVPPATVNLTASGGTISSAVSTATIGTDNAGAPIGSSGNPYRCGTQAFSVRNQWLILSSELTSAGLQAGSQLSSITFTVSSTSGGTINNQTFRIAHTTNNDFTSTSFLTETFTTVYSNPSNFSPLVGANIHNFTTNFIWNGTSNIVVDECHYILTSSVDNISPIIETFTTSFNSTNSYQNNTGTSVCSFPTGTLLTKRPVIKFNISGILPTWTWSPNTSDNTSVVTVGPATTTTYTATATINGCSTSGSAIVNVNSNTPNCPNTSSIAPSSTQTICQNATASQLTASYTSIGTTGTPTVQYQWYYNTTNSNTVLGATLIAGQTSSTFTPPSTTIGTRYYFCVVYATNNGCGQTNATQSLSSNAVAVTVKDIITWANTQSPISGSICVGGVYNVYGKVFVPGVTPTSGAQSGMVAELGYSTSNSLPSGADWTWVTASYNAQVLNDDEYMATLSGLTAGTYYYAYRFSFNSCGPIYGGINGVWSATSDNGILTVYNTPTVTITPSNICNGATNVAVSATGASTYELLLNGVSQGYASSTASWTVPGPLSTGASVCVRGYDANNLVMNGSINETFWGHPISTSAGGPGSGFGSNRINALYARNGFGYLNLAVAGSLMNDNKIFIFLDTKSGGYNNLSTWTNRSNAPNYAMRNFNGLNGGIQFDAGFEPDYIVSIGVDGVGNSYLDVYDMTNNANTYIGNTTTAPTLFAYQSNTGATDYTKGYEIRIPNSLIGTMTTPIKLFGMLTNNPAIGSATFLSNQFLSPAGSSDGNYADGAVNFGNATPNPISFTLNSDCYIDVCKTVAAYSNPTFTQVAAICSGTSLSALPTTSNNGFTGTWSPALNNTATTTYTFTPAAGQCANNTIMDITVNSVPILSNATLSVCTGVAFSHTPTGSNIPTGTTYSWSAPTGANFTGGASGSAASTVDDMLILSSGSSTTAVYNVTPTFSGCAGNSFTVTVSLSSCAPPVPFTACNLVVYKVGDGTANILATNALPVSIDELNPSGTLVQNISSIFNGANNLKQSGGATSVGMLNSYNGLLSIPGYAVANGTALNPNANPASPDLIYKVNTILDNGQTLQSYTNFPTSAPIPYSGEHFRSSIPTGSSSFYAAGAGTNQGLYYVNSGVFTLLASSNARVVEIYNNQLYMSTSANVFKVGTGLPTTGAQSTIALLPSYSNSGIYGFSISPDGCTLYVADNGSNSTYRGISKYKLIGSTWTFQYNFNGWGIGLLVDYSGVNDVIYITTATNGSNPPNKVEKLIDNPSANSFTAITTGWPITAVSNYRFAGIDFTPNSTTIIANPITTQPIASASLCNTQTQTLSVTASGSPTYQWYSNTVNSSCGATPISGAVNATYTPPATSINNTVYYFVKVSVNCTQIFFSNISAVTTVINPTPTATNNSPFCSGQNNTLTLETPTVSTATYSWTGPNSFSSSTQNPEVTTNATSVHAGVYSVTTTVSGCTSPAGTTNVVVNQNPSINALSPP